MAYKVIVDFKDLRDDGYEYKSGDKYPHSGTPDMARVKQLITPTSMRGPLIAEVAEEKPAAKKVEKSEKTEKAEKSAGSKKS